MSGSSHLDSWVTIVRRYLEAGPPVRIGPSRLTTEDLKQFGAEVAARMAQDGELVAWDELERSRLGVPPEDVREAVAGLANQNTSMLTAVLSSSENVLAIFVATRFLDWNDALGQRWLQEPCSKRIAGLGLLRWLRNVSTSARTSANTELATTEATSLSTVSAALQARNRAEEIDFWLQILGIIHRLVSTDNGSMSPMFVALHEQAALSLARNGGSDAFLPDSHTRLRVPTNSFVAAVVPLVAAKISGAEQDRLLTIYFRDVLKHLDGALHEQPVLTQPSGQFYANACGLAMELELRAGRALLWWQENTARYCDTLQGWKGDASALAMERAAWLACAATIAWLRLQKQGDPLGQALEPAVCAVADRYLEEWLWQLGTPFAARPAFACLLVEALAGATPVNTQRIMAVAREIHDAGMLSRVKQLAEPVLSPSDIDALTRLLSERESFEYTLS